MKNIFFDSNIWLRLFLQDNKDQYDAILQLLSYTDEGLFRPYTSTIVFLEVNYVLRSFYKLSHEKSILYLSKIKETRNITIIDETDINGALKYYNKYRIKFTDCLIASQIRDNIILVTYDRDFMKLKNISVKTPEDMIEVLKN